MNLRKFGLYCIYGICFFGSAMGCFHDRLRLGMDAGGGDQPTLERLAKLKDDVNNKVEWSGVIGRPEGGGFLVEDSRGFLRHLRKKEELLLGMLKRTNFLETAERTQMQKILKQCKAAIAVVVRAHEPGGSMRIDMRKCGHCGTLEKDLGRNLDKCSQCKSAYYCNRECQLKHWKEHKQECSDGRSRTRTIVVHGEDAQILQAVTN